MILRFFFFYFWNTASEKQSVQCVMLIFIVSHFLLLFNFSYILQWSYLFKKLGSRPVVRRDTCKYYLIQACSFLPWMVVRCQSDTFFFLFSYKSSTYDCNIHRTSHMFHVCKPNIMLETRAQLKRSAVVIWEHLTWIYCSDRSVCHRADIKYILVLILF